MVFQGTAVAIYKQLGIMTLIYNEGSDSLRNTHRLKVSINKVTAQFTHVFYIKGLLQVPIFKG